MFPIALEGREANLCDACVGLDKLGALLKKWNQEPSGYSPQEMKECLDSWKEVLFTHLDQEVREFLHWRRESGVY